ncbi:hypothetical protein HGO53_00050 [Wolbachia endosymbiont of Diaphorina citri]|uniref:hypothetical protein n=1 Tax=Wolbachia endosymbiont of Diaphorina citri TaxID=116598 RepID=UPI00155E5D13|nr:hypothetical protein [Wolbachia endosymbiont of Diaphorina citri]QJT93920.1 hypothetical protein HGO48_00050 [Wolbachia endosymbiont of Diaphorina citri]QJT95160.1 hypothetical protein HGO49_00050 [Wolbachia endosymbiont of Diaphorina citri]QJT96407.1 hypothetical protein HGO53_00050 [Wolbachia endosymbiont of Diaphorina citri]QLK10817.1 hypothetical protein FK497_00050 [Wolbachia endosymbiont of Diaphorina citri]QXY87694.1 hypothetical protein GZ065_00050 [Wolbachia endosymbiont of Diaphor
MESPEINISLGGEALKGLNRLSKVKKQSAQELVEELIQEAAEREEEIALFKLAVKRDVPNAKFIKHEDINWD